MNDLVFKPIIPTANIFLLIMLVIVLINRKHVINRILIIALLFIINQRPMLKNRINPTFTLNLDVAFVIDTTVSMNANDVEKGLRMDEAKAVCKKIMNAFPGSQFEVITYDNTALMRYPFTTDNAAVENIIDNLTVINPLYSRGSALTMPIEFLHMSLSSQEERSEYHGEKRQNIVFIIGDGELNNEERLRTNFDKYTELAGMIDNGAVIGIGTREGGNIRLFDENKNPLYAGTQDVVYGINSRGYISILDYVNDSGFMKKSNLSSELEVSICDENNLKELADKLNLDYFNSADNKLDSKLESIKEKAVDSQDEKQKKDQDIYYYFSIPAAFLLIYELYYYRRIAN